MSTAIEARDQAAVAVATIETALDFETRLIAPQEVFPKPICWTAAWRPAPGAEILRGLVANGDANFWTDFEFAVDDALTNGNVLIFHGGPGFDLPVAVIHNPPLTSKVWLLFEKGLIRDTSIREKLLNLATHGNVDKFFTPDGKAFEIPYDLAALVKKYLGRDRSAEKGEKDHGSRKPGQQFEGEKKKKQDVWRFHYETLDGVPSSQYPKEAGEYAVFDTVDTLLVKEGQDSISRDKFVRRGATFPDGSPFDVFKTEVLHNGAKFALSFMTYWGFGVIASEVVKVRAAVERAITPERTYLLYERVCDNESCPRYKTPCKDHGLPPLLTRAQPAKQTYKKDGKPGRILQPKKEKCSFTVLRKLIEDTWLKNAYCDDKSCSRYGRDCPEHGLPPLQKTEPSNKFPNGQISTNAEAIEDIAPFNPVLEQFVARESLKKLWTLEIPRLEEALQHGGTIHGGFDEFKRTGRTSSKRSKSFPSVNVQQIPRWFDVEYPNECPCIKDGVIDQKCKKCGGKGVRTERINPRNCYGPRNPGWVLASVDYAFIELCTLAQQVYKHVGYSVLRDKINAGYDPHAFLGAQLAAGLDRWFSALVVEKGASGNTDAIATLFADLKKSKEKEHKDLYKKYRNFAKPTGLGFPGGLGAKTLIAYAKGTFGVTIASVEQAKSFKEVWLKVFPEMNDYLGRRGYVVEKLRDEAHSTPEEDRYGYFSPLGVYRANCTFTAAANGWALQTPTGEGAKIATFNVTRACWDPALNSCLYGCRPNAFVHDEMIVEIPRDQWMHERCEEIGKIMVDSMKVITPDMNIKTEPTLMEKWDKAAELVLGPEGVDDRIRIWRAEDVPTYKQDAKGRLRSAV